MFVCMYICLYVLMYINTSPWKPKRQSARQILAWFVNWEMGLLNIFVNRQSGECLWRRSHWYCSSFKNECGHVHICIHIYAYVYTEFWIKKLCIWDGYCSLAAVIIIATQMLVRHDAAGTALMRSPLLLHGSFGSCECVKRRAVHNTSHTNGKRTGAQQKRESAQIITALLLYIHTYVYT